MECVGAISAAGLRVLVSVDGPALSGWELIFMRQLQMPSSSHLEMKGASVWNYLWAIYASTFNGRREEARSSKFKPCLAQCGTCIAELKLRGGGKGARGESRGYLPPGCV